MSFSFPLFLSTTPRLKHWLGLIVSPAGFALLDGWFGVEKVTASWFLPWLYLQALPLSHAHGGQKAGLDS